MDNVRIYLLSAGQHGPAAFPPVQTIGQQRNNPLDYRWAMKALLLAMDRVDGQRHGAAAEPLSARRRQHAGGARQAAISRRCRASRRRTAVHRAYRADYGPQFATEGVVTVEPPKIGTAFPILVPQVDADGNGVAGIRMPELAVPLATYTGWNLFNDRSGPTDVLSSMQGSYIPLPAKQRRAQPHRAIRGRRSRSGIATRITTSARVRRRRWS